MAKGGSSGGGFGSGVGLVTGAVAVNTCPIDNQTFFCQFSRVFQMITWVFTILVFLYIAYMFVSVYFFSKRRSRLF
jgi:preprotein translocase subunit SecY